MGKLLPSVLISFLLVSSPSLAGEKSSVVVGGVTVTLGMSFDEAVETLEKSLSLQQAWTKDAKTSFYVWSKETPQRYFGQLVFTDGKLTSIGRTWATDPLVTAEDATRALLGALRSATSSGAPCKSIVKNSDQPDIQAASIEFTCGHRIVSIALLRSKVHDPPESVQVDEWLYAKR